MNHSFPEIRDLNTVVGPVVTLTPIQREQLTEAVKADTDKPDWSLLPTEATEEIVKVLAFGAKKYSANNWMQGNGFSYSRVLNSLLRHIFAYMRGEDNDPESGLSHLAHAGCNIVFLLYYNKYKKHFNKDDRLKATWK